jgi:phosphatidylinositol alpha-1,6-mannosyltransferase
MRALLVTWNYPPKQGGIETLLAQLVQHLAPVLEIQVIGPYAGPQKAMPDQVLRPAWPGLLWFGVHACWAGLRLLRRQRYDVILAGSVVVVPIARLLGQIFRLPVVAMVHGLDLVYPHAVYQWMVRTVLPTCARVVAVSRAALDAALACGVDRARAGVIPPGIACAECTALPDAETVRRTYGLDGWPLLLSTGRLARRKGVLEFIAAALPRIVARYPHASP